MLFKRYGLVNSRWHAENGVRGLLAVLVWALSAGCATQGTSPDERPATQRDAESVSSTKQGVSVSDSKRHPRAPAANIAAIRRAGDVYEIEVHSPDGFPPRGLPPVLHIGDKQFDRSRPSDSVGLYGLIFTLSAEEFESLPENSPIVVGYGPSPRGAQGYGRLNKATLSVAK